MFRRTWIAPYHFAEPIYRLLWVAACCSGYNQSLGPTNATGTPTIKNLLIKDVLLTDVMGPATIFTLAESPVRTSLQQQLLLLLHHPTQYTVLV